MSCYQQDLSHKYRQRAKNYVHIYRWYLIYHVILCELMHLKTCIEGSRKYCRPNSKWIYMNVMYNMGSPWMSMIFDVIWLMQFAQQKQQWQPSIATKRLLGQCFWQSFARCCCNLACIQCTWTSLMHYAPENKSVKALFHLDFSLLLRLLTFFEGWDIL